MNIISDSATIIDLVLYVCALEMPVWFCLRKKNEKKEYNS